MLCYTNSKVHRVRRTLERLFILKMFGNMYNFDTVSGCSTTPMATSCKPVTISRALLETTTRSESNFFF